MNIVNKLTLRHLKENKGRSIVTTLGICVSVAMITAVFVAVASFLNFYGEIGLVNNGNYHFQVTDSKEKIEEVLDNHKDEIESVGYSVSLDDNYSGYKIPNGTVMRYSVGSWIVGDEQYFKQFVTCDYDGELPKNENEIMVEQDVIEKNGFDWKIGDTVEIDTGSRANSNGDGLFTMPVKGLYNFGEKFEKTETKSYKIVGILHNNIPTLYTGKILRGMAQNETENVTASIILNNVNINTIKEINAIVDEFNFPKDLKPFCVNVNNDYLETKFAIDPENSSIMTLLPMCLILLAIIMAASVALIYNAFSMSYAEKVRYLGMLSSVGATRKQKKKSVYFEGFVLGAIGIPVGFGAGVLGIGITLKAISGELLKSGMINSQDSVDFKVVVPLYAVVCTLVLSIVTIFISVFKPARKASAIMPIDAIRQTNEIKLKKKINLINGRRIVEAPMAYPSTKLCVKCDHKKDNIKLSDRIYECTNCGLKIDRDLNAASNLFKYMKKTIGYGSSKLNDEEFKKLEKDLKINKIQYNFVELPNKATDYTKLINQSNKAKISLSNV